VIYIFFGVRVSGNRRVTGTMNRRGVTYLPLTPAGPHRYELGMVVSRLTALDDPASQNKRTNLKCVRRYTGMAIHQGCLRLLRLGSNIAV